MGGGGKMLCPALNLSRKNRATKTTFSTLFAESHEAQCECKPNTYPHISVCWVMSQIRYLRKEEPLAHLWPASITKLCHFHLAIESTWYVGSADSPPNHTVSPREVLWFPYAQLCTFGHHWKLLPEKSGFCLVIWKEEGM